jgi:hypothetical protein
MLLLLGDAHQRVDYVICEAPRSKFCGSIRTWWTVDSIDCVYAVETRDSTHTYIIYTYIYESKMHTYMHTCTYISVYIYIRVTGVVSLLEDPHC